MRHTGCRCSGFFGGGGSSRSGRAGGCSRSRAWVHSLGVVFSGACSSGCRSAQYVGKPLGRGAALAPASRYERGRLAAMGCGRRPGRIVGRWPARRCRRASGPRITWYRCSPGAELTGSRRRAGPGRAGLGLRQFRSSGPAGARTRVPPLGATLPDHGLHGVSSGPRRWSTSPAIRRRARLVASRRNRLRLNLRSLTCTQL